MPPSLYKSISVLSFEPVKRLILAMTLMINCRLYLSLGILCLLQVVSCKQGENQQDAPVVYATAETQPVAATSADDAADDPAIWVHPFSPHKSLIIGTNKTAGLAIYDLNGKELFFTPAGDVNNVDIREGWPLNDTTTVPLVGSTERRNNELLIQYLDTAKRELVELARIPTSTRSIYGFCLYKSTRNGAFYAIYNDQDGNVGQMELKPTPNAGLTAHRVRSLKIETQTEGMVADDELGILYIGEENKGIWEINAEPDTAAEVQFLPLSGADNPDIAFDIEGLAIYQQGQNDGYLIASSQGNNRFVLYDRKPPHAYLGYFEIQSGAYDSVGETDGIEVTSQNLGGPYGKGLFIAQDGENQDAAVAKAQNFKLVPWEAIATRLSLR